MVNTYRYILIIVTKANVSIITPESQEKSLSLTPICLTF